MEITDEQLATALNIAILPAAAIRGWDKVVGNFLAVAGPSIRSGTLSGRPMKLRILVEDNGEFDAFASTVRDTDVIVVSVGAIALLAGICRAIASHRALLPTWRSDAASIPKPIVCQGSLDELFRNENRSELPLAGVLDDPRREDVTTYLWHFSLYYLLSHEFQHIYAGHCQLPTPTRLGPTLREIHAGAGNPSDGFEDETLEWDADCAALIATFAMVLRPSIAEVEDRQTWKLPDSYNFGDLHDTMTFALAPGLIISLVLWALNPSDVRSEAPDSHPHPLIRLHQAITFAPQLLSYRTGTAIEEWAEVVARAGAVVTSIFRTVFPGLSLPSEVNADDIHAIAGRRVKIFEETWARIRPQLDKLKRGGRLAPSVPSRHPAFPENATEG